ncbi:MAG TPA: prepilin-type N-terminal cleavage/methylation domain-containing protein [bacterium]|nr:prepilin-type N-terminal cleavage/methylation domain-containing protein [bacterium]
MKLKNNNKGFSLLELLIVVIIIGILALGLLPNFRESIKAVRMSTAGKSLCAAVRLAQRYAVSENKTVNLCIDIDNEKIYAEFSDGTLIAQSTYTMPSEVNITSVNYRVTTINLVQTSGIYQIPFRPDGSVGNMFNFVRFAYSPYKETDESLTNKNEYRTLVIQGQTSRPKILNYGWMTNFE